MLVRGVCPEGTASRVAWNKEVEDEERNVQLHRSCAQRWEEPEREEVVAQEDLREGRGNNLGKSNMCLCLGGAPKK